MPYRLVVALAAAVLAGVAAAWFYAERADPSPRPFKTPAAEQLVSPGRTVEAALRMELAPGHPPALAVVSSTDSRARCASSALKDPAPFRFLDVFIFDTQSKKWESAYYASKLPERFPLLSAFNDVLTREGVQGSSLANLSAGNVPCLFRRDMAIQVVRLRPDRDYLAVQTFVNSGLGTGTGNMFLLGWVDDDLSVVYSESHIGSVAINIDASRAVFTSNLYLRSDANCCPSGKQEVTLSWEDATNRVVASAPKAVPDCTSGRIVRIQDEISEDQDAERLVPPSPQSLPTRRYVQVACTKEGKFGRTWYTFGVSPVRIQASALFLALGDSVKMTEWGSKPIDRALPVYRFDLDSQAP